MADSINSPHSSPVQVDSTQDQAARPDPAPELQRPGWNWRDLLSIDAGCTALVTAALGFGYAPIFRDLYSTWDREPDYSHGFLVLPIALFILYRLWPADPADRPRVWWPGMAIVLIGLGLRAWFHSLGRNWSEISTLFVVVVGLGFSRLGPRTMLRVWPAFAFLIFWFPLPNGLNSLLSQPLQSIATRAATAVLRFTGLWVIPEGNVIVVGADRLEVAAACNGLSMLMSLAAAVVATASIVPMPLLKRLTLLVTIIPIALVSNILRIAATAWCYHHFGAEVGSKYAHDAAGWLMMPTAMIFVGLELLIMSWLIVESPMTISKNFDPSYFPVRQPNLGEVRR